MCDSRKSKGCRRRERRRRQRDARGRPHSTCRATLQHLVISRRSCVLHSMPRTTDDSRRFGGRCDFEASLAALVANHVVGLVLVQQVRQHVAAVETGCQVKRSLAARVLRVDRGRAVLEDEFDDIRCSDSRSQLGFHAERWTCSCARLAHRTARCSGVLVFVCSLRTPVSDTAAASFLPASAAAYSSRSGVIWAASPARVWEHQQPRESADRLGERSRRTHPCAGPRGACTRRATLPC